MGLLDGTLQQKIKRLEKITSPSQYPKPSQDSIDKLRRDIRESASKKKTPKSKTIAKKTPKSKLKIRKKLA